MKVYSTRTPKRVGKRRDRWQNAICVGYKNDDKKQPIWKYQTVTAHSKLEAIQKRSEWIAEVEGTTGDPFGEVLYRSWLKCFLEDCMSEGLALKTVEGYKQIIDCRIIPKLGDLNVKDITPGMLTSFYRELKNSGSADGGPLASGTVKKTAAVINSSLNAAVAQGIISVNPNILANHFTSKRGAPKKSDEVAFSSEEIKTITTRAKLCPNRGLAAAIMITSYSGLRRAEVLGLTWGAIDLKHNRMMIERDLVEVTKAVAGEYSGIDDTLQESDTKTPGSVRNLPIVEPLSRFLHEEYDRQLKLSAYAGREFNESSPVVQNTRGKAFRPSTLTTEFKEFIRSCDVNHKGSFKSLRSGVGSFLGEQGLPVAAVSELLGHADKATTLKYYLKNVSDPNLLETMGVLELGLSA